MKIKISIILIAMVSILILSGCSGNDSNGRDKDQKFCTEDAKVCPDGSAVGRNPENNCEFYQCPNPDEKPIPVEPDGGIGDTPIPVEPDNGIGLTNPYVKYVSENVDECKTMLFQCIEGAEAFSDSTGCGCKAIEPKKYVGKDLEECKRIRFVCEKNYEYFSDEDGCGCEFSFEAGAVQEEPTDGKIKAFDCPDIRPTMCTKEYMPVCGQVQVECIRAPCNPVKQTFGNKCEACANSRTISYMLGECGTELK